MSRRGRSFSTGFRRPAPAPLAPKRTTASSKTITNLGHKTGVINRSRSTLGARGAQAARSATAVRQGARTVKATSSSSLATRTKAGLSSGLSALTKFATGSGTSSTAARSAITGGLGALVQGKGLGGALSAARSSASDAIAAKPAEPDPETTNNLSRANTTVNDDIDHENGIETRHDDTLVDRRIVPSYAFLNRTTADAMTDQRARQFDAMTNLPLPMRHSLLPRTAMNAVATMANYKDALVEQNPTHPDAMRGPTGQIEGMAPLADMDMIHITDANGMRYGSHSGARMEAIAAAMPYLADQGDDRTMTTDTLAGIDQRRVLAAMKPFVRRITEGPYDSPATYARQYWQASNVKSMFQYRDAMAADHGKWVLSGDLYTREDFTGLVANSTLNLAGGVKTGYLLVVPTVIVDAFRNASIAGDKTGFGVDLDDAFVHVKAYVRVTYPASAEMASVAMVMEGPGGNDQVLQGHAFDAVGSTVSVFDVTVRRSEFHNTHTSHPASAVAGVATANLAALPRMAYKLFLSKLPIQVGVRLKLSSRTRVRGAATHVPTINGQPWTDPSIFGSFGRVTERSPPPVAGNTPQRTFAHMQKAIDTYVATHEHCTEETSPFYQAVSYAMVRSGFPSMTPLQFRQCLNAVFRIPQVGTSAIWPNRPFAQTFVTSVMSYVETLGLDNNITAATKALVTSPAGPVNVMASRDAAYADMAAQYSVARPTSSTTNSAYRAVHYALGGGSL